MKTCLRSMAFQAAQFLVTASILCVTSTACRADDWPQWLGPERDGVWREAGILEQFPEHGLDVLWRTAIGAGYAGPAVVGERVYVTDRQLASAAEPPANPFDRGKLAGRERALCLDARDGRILWVKEYDCPYDVSYPAGPRATPLVDGSRVYTLGTEGDLFCLDAASGQALWEHHFKPELGVTSPMWGFAAHPLLDGDRLICMARGDGSTVIAYDKTTGKELWRALSASEPGYCPPMIYTLAGQRQLIVWTPEAVHALEPETGRPLWSHPFDVRSGLCIATPRQQGDRLFFTCFYNGSRLLEVSGDGSAVDVVWRSRSQSERNTESLHSIISTPFWDGAYIYGVCSYGQLRCLRADTGERVWASLQATGGKETRWANAFLVKHGDRYFLANEQGELIIAKLTPSGYEELGRTKLLEPTNTAAGRDVVWSHPAFADRCVYARNDQEIVCASLALTSP